MTRFQIRAHALVTLIMIFGGCTLLGYATSWLVGLGVFFSLWGLAGVIEMIIGWRSE
jgi:hypothetical protein